MTAKTKGTMDAPGQSELTEVIKIGRDRITITGGQVIIDAAREMPDWKVREFNPLAVYFRGGKYVLRVRTAAEHPYAKRYILEPWTADSGEVARNFVTYDEEAVAEREGAVRSGRVDALVRAVLILFYPLLGLLWSNTKEKLNRFGFISRSLTGASIMMTFLLLLMEGVFAQILISASLRSGRLTIGGMLRAAYGHDELHLGPLSVRVVWLDAGLFVLMLLDCVIRYGQHLKNDDDPPWGFLEWMTGIFRRKE